MLIQEIGEARWAELVNEISALEPVFARPILATTILPIRPFLRFNDIIVRRIYDGDVQSYFHFGEMSAQWSLTQGPYKHLLAAKNVDSFAALAKVIYSNYFTEGRAESRIIRDGGRTVIELRLLDIPREVHHAYFEYAICGYFKRGLELVSGGAVTMKPLRQFVKGDPDVLYEYVLG